MINYEKLKIAHELAKKSDARMWHYVDKNKDNASGYEFQILTDDAFERWGKHSYTTNDIDEVIAKLQELTQPNPKYKQEQTVWFLSQCMHNEIEDGNISEAEYQDGVLLYSIYNKRDYWQEHQLYPTKSALIEAQIATWLRMKDELCKKCGLDLLDTQYSSYFSCQHEWEKCEYQPQFEGEIKGFNQADYTLCKSTTEYCQVSGAKLDKCQHEPDGREHVMTDEGGCLIMNRCKKCGEFHR